MTLLSQLQIDAAKDWNGKALTNVGNITTATGKLTLLDILLKRLTASGLAVRDALDTAYRDLTLRNLNVEDCLAFKTTDMYVAAPNIDNAYIMLKAKDNGVGLVEVARLVGAATPTFDLLAGRLTGNLNANSKKITGLAAPAASGDAARKDEIDAFDARITPLEVIPVGNLLIASSDAGVDCHSLTYVKVKEIKFNFKCTARVSFGLTAESVDHVIYGRIYKNGVAVGTERSTTSESGELWSEDISGILQTDLIQLYAKVSDVLYHGTSYNFRTYVSTIPTAVVIT